MWKMFLVNKLFLPCKADQLISLLSTAVSGSLKKVGSVIYNHPIGKDYKWYISGIYCQLGDCISPRDPFSVSGRVK